MSIGEQAGRAYHDAVTALSAIAISRRATKEQKDRAKAAREALDAAWRDGVRADFAGRTVQYNLLVARLREIADRIVTDPLKPIRDQLNAAIEVAKAALVEQAGSLPPAAEPVPGAAEAEAEAVAAGRAFGPGEAAAPPAADDGDPPAPPAAAPPLPGPGLDAAAAASPVPAALYKEYAALFESCLVRPGHAALVDAAAKRIVAGKERYRTVEARTGVPWWVIGLIHSLECGCRFDRHLHNGDPLSQRTVRVPAGCPQSGDPPFEWEDSAADALRQDRLAGWSDWSVPAVLYRLEKYNGWGYRRHHPEVLSPYLWSFTSHYTRGKYVADGRFDANAVSKQVGAAAILRCLANDGALA